MDTKIGLQDRIILEVGQNGLLEILEKPAWIEVLINYQGKKLICISPKVWERPIPVVEELINLYEEDYSKY